MDWQPIETAPQRTLVLLFDNEGNIRMGVMATSTQAVSELDFGDVSSTVYWPKDLRPTHWMYLPNNPRAKP
jgi:hypothetical protein